MLNPWPAIVWRILGILLVAALLGWASGQITLALLVAALTCLGWQLLHLYRLERWLRDKESIATLNAWWPDAVWNTLYQHIARLRQRSRKRKRKLHRLLEQFQSAATALPDATVVLNNDTAVMWCNEAARRLLGLRSPKDLGLPVTNLVRHPAFVSFIEQQRYEDHIEFPSPVNDALLLSVRIIPYGKKRRLLLAADVSRLHRLEKMRRDFVANVSHELRTPLTVISGYLETLLDSGDTYSEQWDLPLHRMQQQTARMLHIIEDLLVLSRLETQRESTPQNLVNVATMLGPIAEDATALSGEREHTLQVNADPSLWINGWERELRSAFSNLVFNAVQHTPAGSRVIIRWYADEHGAHLEVEDNGEGIPTHHLPRITERFYRVDRGRQRESGGSGLGLSIVKHVMHHHNGRLAIISLIGVGSLFACDFPPVLLVRKNLPAAGPPATAALAQRDQLTS